jgi:hypothetical protein
MASLRLGRFAVTVEVDKEYERKLLLKRIFPTPFTGFKDSLALFEICRELGDPYCLSFNDNGYTSDYKPFDTEEVINRATTLLADDKIFDYYVKKYKDKLSPYHDFKGRYYTYDHKTKNLRFESVWGELKKRLDEFFDKYENDGMIVLRAIYEVYVKLDKRRHNFHMILGLAKENGLRKGWFIIKARLEMMEIVEDGGDISIPEELIPFLRNILYPD